MKLYVISVIFFITSLHNNAYTVITGKALNEKQQITAKTNRLTQVLRTFQTKLVQLSNVLKNIKNKLSPTRPFLTPQQEFASIQQELNKKLPGDFKDLLALSKKIVNFAITHTDLFLQEIKHNKTSYNNINSIHKKLLESYEKETLQLASSKNSIEQIIAMLCFLELDDEDDDDDYNEALETLLTNVLTNLNKTNIVQQFVFLLSLFKIYNKDLTPEEAKKVYALTTEALLKINDQHQIIKPIANHIKMLVKNFENAEKLAQHIIQQLQQGIPRNFDQLFKLYKNIVIFNIKYADDYEDILIEESKQEKIEKQIDTAINTLYSQFSKKLQQNFLSLTTNTNADNQLVSIIYFKNLAKQGKLEEDTDEADKLSEALATLLNTIVNTLDQNNIHQQVALLKMFLKISQLELEKNEEKQVIELAKQALENVNRNNETINELAQQIEEIIAQTD